MVWAFKEEFRDVTGIVVGVDGHVAVHRDRKTDRADAGFARRHDGASLLEGTETNATFQARQTRRWSTRIRQRC